MAKAKSSESKSNGNDSGLNIEAQLWAAADKMRGHMDASGIGFNLRANSHDRNFDNLRWPLLL